MDALFVIPTLISSNVPERLVPGISKMVERNMLLTFSSQIRSAALRRYANIFATSTSESASGDVNVLFDMLTEKEDVGEKLGFSNPVKFNVDPLAGASSKESKDRGREKIKDTEVELPTGLHFYNQIGLEPTYIEIPVEMKNSVWGSTGKSERLIRVGLKSIPYQIEGIDNLKNALFNPRTEKYAKSGFARKWKTLKRKVSPTRKRIYRGDDSTGDQVRDILLGPSSDELANPRLLAKMMKTRSASRWSSVVVLTTYDLSEDELRDTLKSYALLVRKGWGDIVIVNEDKESISFCMQKMMACQDIPYTYLRQVLRMDTVLDYKEISRYTRPFRTVSIRSALRDSVGIEIPEDSRSLKEMMDEYLKE